MKCISETRDPAFVRYRPEAPCSQIILWGCLPSATGSTVKVWKCESLSRVPLFMTMWTVAHQAPLSMGFSRHECWGVRGDRPDSWVESRSPALQADSLLSELPGEPRGLQYQVVKFPFKRLKPAHLQQLLVFDAVMWNVVWAYLTVWGWLWEEMLVRSWNQGIHTQQRPLYPLKPNLITACRS